jgi:hypothetical protein
MGDFDDQGLPARDGIYLVREDGYGSRNVNIDVYNHPVKGLCCFSEDFGSAGSGVDDLTDCHVSVQCTGLEFIERVGDLD